MISYIAISAEKTEVRLDGKMVGTIKSVPGGYSYFPKGSKTGGDVFASIGACKKSLEIDA